MLQSNFKQAEYCYIEHDQLNEAINMYKTMHMWNELFDLVETRCPSKSNELREEYFKHLISTGQYQIAARLKVRFGEINEAIDLCLQGDKPQLAADILLNSSNNDKVNPQILNQVANSLIKSNKFDYAGQIFEKLGKVKEALEAYRKGHSYYRALELSKVSSPETVIEIEKEWADYLVSQGQNDVAIQHYIESGDYSLALNCSLRSQQWNQAANILQSIASNVQLRQELKLQYLRVGRYFASINDVNTAEDLFLTVDAHKELIELYLTHNKIDEALRIGKKQFKYNQMEQIFIETAKKLEKKSQTRKTAENIYVSINKPELAIEMYQKIGDNSNVLRLTNKFSNDKSQLITLAQQSERDGRLTDAESYYIRSGEWEKALFMYEQEKKWKDALRVAKQNGTKESEIKVAAHWAIDNGGQSGVNLLQKLKLVNEVLIYSCENGLNELAQNIMQYCKALNQNTLKQAHMKFAVNLEAQGKLKEAEEHYLLADQPREVIEMYIHNNMYSDAQKIALKYGINDIPINNNTKSLKKSLDNNNSNKLEIAVKLEQNGKYDEAIDTYLSLTPDDCGGLAQYDQVLERVVKITLTFRQNRLADVVNEVAQILLNEKRHASLAKILEGIELYPDAFEIYKAGGMWDDAARLSGYLEPDEQKQFQIEYQQYLAQNQNTSGLIEIGQIDKALNILAQKGDWQTCLSNAQKEGEQYLEKYTMLYAQELINQEKYYEAISILAKYSPSANSNNIPSYIILCQTIIYNVPNYDEINNSFYLLRQMFFKILNNYSANNSNYNKLKHFTYAIHLLCQQDTCQKYQLNQIYSNVVLSLLRYCDVLPADFLFFKAGNTMERQNNLEAALVFYNTFVDIVEVINTGDISNSDGIDHSKYDQTDIPKEFCLRKNVSINSDDLNHANDLVLEKAVSGEYEPKLPLTKCPKCGKNIFVACLSCVYCKSNFECCCITGLPVINPTRCTACGAVANRSDWGKYIAKVGRCPCCNSPQTAGA
ncbi:selective LIM binding factor [Histomonas meleagridis]|nr:selective LIM binding factor [Histomonas meleagridis]